MSKRNWLSTLSVTFLCLIGLALVGLMGAAFVAELIPHG